MVLKYIDPYGTNKKPATRNAMTGNTLMMIIFVSDLDGLFLSSRLMRCFMMRSFLIINYSTLFIVPQLNSPIVYYRKHTRYSYQSK